MRSLADPILAHRVFWPLIVGSTLYVTPDEWKEAKGARTGENETT